VTNLAWSVLIPHVSHIENKVTEANDNRWLENASSEVRVDGSMNEIWAVGAILLCVK
jgi:hypothetical protein